MLSNRIEIDREFLEITEIEPNWKKSFRNSTSAPYAKTHRTRVLYVPKYGNEIY
jgi:hypothetical protein